jgi:hypothetical protein
MKDSTTELTWEVFTSDPHRTLGDATPTGQQYRIWPPLSSTLIAGRNSAVLVDVPITTWAAPAILEALSCRRN